MMGTPTGFVEMMRTGQLRALAISSDKRSVMFPDVPTFKEVGLGEATYEVWIGMLAPAGLPKAVNDNLGAALEVARNQPDIVRQLEGAGQVISDVRTAAQFDAMLRDENTRLRKLITELGIEAE